MSPLDLFNAHLDGQSLSTDQSRQVAEWLAEDPRNVECLVDLAWIHEQLDGRLSVPRLLEQLARTGDPKTRAGIRAAIRRVEGLRLDGEPTAPLVSRPARHSLRHVYALAVAASLLIAALGIGVSRLLAPDETGDAPLGAQVASVTAAIDTLAGAPAATFGDAIRQGEVLIIPQGIVECSTIDGATIVIEGPAKLAFASSKSIDLVSGRLAARVSGSRSLVVVTPTAKITDLGTEFGVAVGPDSDTSLAVYEGRVLLESTAGTGSMSREITANRAGYVDAAGGLRSTIKSVPHGREFVRPDEVALLLAARDGSADAKGQSLAYRLLRVPGLAGIQSFDRDAVGDDGALTFGAPANGDIVPQFRDNLRPGGVGKSGALWVDADHAMFVPLAVKDSLLNRGGFVDDRELVGPSGAEIWLSWRTQAEGTQVGDYQGLSLMFGDQRITQEPIFVGASEGSDEAALAVNVGSRAVRYPLDFDPAPGIQTRKLGSEVHLWTVRICFGQRSDAISVWCDVAADELATTRPHAEAVSAYVAFDRVRMAVARDAGPWLFDDLRLSTSIEGLRGAAEVLDSN